MANFEIKLPQPSPKQIVFLQDRHKFVAFGGARGGGKSFIVRVKAILLALQFAGIKIMIIRRSYPELVENHIKPTLAMLPVGAYKYNDGKKELTLNGSQILFRYCAGDKDLLNYQGLETDVLFVDEATQLSEETFKVLSACVRGVNDYPKRIYLTCNPGGVGHAWVKRLFVDRKFSETENPAEYSFIQSFVTDNKALLKSNPDYIKQLEALPPKLREAWLKGNWDIFEGQFFEDFVDDPKHYLDRRHTHVIDPFDIPREWRIYRSFDFGYAKPFSVGWWAVDYDGRAYRILELYGCTQTPNEGVKWSPDKIFREVKRIENEHRWLKGQSIRGVADPSIWDKSRGESIAEMSEREGVYWEPGKNNRLNGWMQLHYRLAFDDDGIPMMYIFKNCKGFIRTIPSLCYDDNKPEDLDTSQEDHIADETRYFCMMRPIKPQEKTGRKAIADDPLNLQEDLRRYRAPIF